eukprot:m.390708 g.390708  ORF g.390708 m.390708 type:complete len:73 (-) comp21062_c0_seq2:3215-3433(-)
MNDSGYIQMHCGFASTKPNDCCAQALVTDSLGNLYATGLIWKSGSKTFIKKWNPKDLQEAFARNTPLPHTTS